VCWSPLSEPPNTDKRRLLMKSITGGNVCNVSIITKVSYWRITYVDSEQVAGDVFSRLGATQCKSSTINVVCLRVHVTYLPQKTLVVVDRGGAYKSRGQQLTNHSSQMQTLGTTAKLFPPMKQ